MELFALFVYKLCSVWLISQLRWFHHNKQKNSPKEQLFSQCHIPC